MSRSARAHGGEGSASNGVPIIAVVLVIFGGLLLLQTTGAVSWGVWDNLWRFWPVAIIVLGISLLLGRTSPWLASLLIAGLLLGSVAGAWIITERHQDLMVTSLTEPVGGVTSVEAKIAFGAGKLVIDSLYQGSPNLVEADLKTPGQQAEATFRRANDHGILDISMEGQRFLRVSDADWRVSLSRDVPLALDLDGGAATVQMDLRHLQVRQLDVSTGASNVEITLPQRAGDVQAHIGAGAADIIVNVPEGVAARINKNSGLASFTVDTTRFPERNGYYQSPDYDTARDRVALDIRAGAAKVRVR